MRVGDNLQVMGAIGDHSAKVLATLVPSVPCRIIRWGITVHLDTFVFGSGVVQLLHTTHAEDGTISEAAAGTATLTLIDAAEGSVLYCEPTSEVIVKPGDAIDVDLTTGGTSGDIAGFIQYQQLNWDESGDNANYSDATPTNRLTDCSA
jgi:hypothetical protein